MQLIQVVLQFERLNWDIVTFRGSRIFQSPDDDTSNGPSSPMRYLSDRRTSPSSFYQSRTPMMRSHCMQTPFSLDTLNSIAFWDYIPTLWVYAVSSFQWFIITLPRHYATAAAASAHTTTEHRHRLKSSGILKSKCLENVGHLFVGICARVLILAHWSDWGLIMRVRERKRKDFLCVNVLFITKILLRILAKEIEEDALPTVW